MFLFIQGPKKRKRVLHESVKKSIIRHVIYPSCHLQQNVFFFFFFFFKDLIDRGSGYDLGDSFVDDSELVSVYIVS